MEKPPTRQTLELVKLKTRSLWKIAIMRERLQAGVLVNPTTVEGTVEKLMEVLADEIQHRPNG